jgi:hypothetical protein
MAAVDVQNVQNACFGIKETDAVSVNGGLIHWFDVVPEGSDGARPRPFSFTMETSVMWGQHPDSLYRDLKLNLEEPRWREALETCEAEAEHALKRLYGADMVLKTCFYSPPTGVERGRLAWQLRAHKDYDGPDLKTLRPGDVVKVKVANGGLWVDRRGKYGKVRWLVKELSLVKHAEKKAPVELEFV